MARTALSQARTQAAARTALSLARTQADLLQNLILQSQTFSNASWSKAQSSITPDTVADPITGLMTADTFSENGVNSTHSIAQSFTKFLKGETYCFYAIVKNIDPTVPCVLVATNGGVGAVFNLVTGAIVDTPANVTAQIINLENIYGAQAAGWYLCANFMRMVVTTASPTVYSAVSQSVISHTGINAPTFYIAKASLAKVNWPIPYVATTTTANNPTGAVRSKII